MTAEISRETQDRLAQQRRRRADQLFDRALDLLPEERVHFLDVECGGDASLRELVERLLLGAESGASELTPGGGLQGPLWQGLATSLADGHGGLAAGTEIGPYRVVRALGWGGMGEVYLADYGRSERQVALKMVHPGLDNEEVLQRFDRERQILERARHPNIARLFDGGVNRDGRPFLAMEYVDGEHIDSFCDRRCLSIPKRLQLFLQVAKAVSFAHGAQVIHRDIKPSNILVTAAGEAKLLDFGIGKLLDLEIAPGAIPLTRSNSRLMTPIYASAEQIRGEPATAASDTYQLGLLLYLLLTSRWPYRLRGSAPGELIRAISEGNPIWPSLTIEDPEPYRPPLGGKPMTPHEVVKTRGAQSANELRQILRGHLDQVVLKALHQNVRLRYKRVESMIDDLQAC